MKMLPYLHCLLTKHQHMPRKERTKSGTGIYHVMLRGINKQDIFEDDEDCLQTELHSQVIEGVWCGNTPTLSTDRCLLWSYTEIMNKEKMITEPSPGHPQCVCHRVTLKNGSSRTVSDLTLTIKFNRALSFVYLLGVF